MQSTHGLKHELESNSATATNADSSNRSAAAPKKKLLFSVLGIALWLIIWQVAAMILNRPLLLPDILQTFSRLFNELGHPSFYLSVLGTLIHVLLGLVPAFILGIFLGLCGAKSIAFNAFLSPVLSLMKSVPIAAIVVLLLISMGSALLAIPVVFFITCPLFYYASRDALLSEDPQLLEMSDRLCITTANRIRFVHRILLAPSIKSTGRVSIGMAFKAGIAAEVIAISANTIGEALYRSKILLDTAGVFAYIIATLVISFLTEKLLLVLVSFLCSPHGKPGCNPKREASNSSASIAKNECLDSPGSVQIMHNPAHPNVIYLLGPSGCGKTTLLHRIYREDTQKSAPLSGCGFLFQEDRLLPELTASGNIRLTCKYSALSSINKYLSELLPEGACRRTVRSFSGGEKRRTALIRAMLSPSNAYYLDEPFAGLDQATASRCMDFILQAAQGRPVYITGHDTSVVINN